MTISVDGGSVADFRTVGPALTNFGEHVEGAGVDA